MAYSRSKPPTSSPGSSRFSIWKARRPWGRGCEAPIVLVSSFTHSPCLHEVPPQPPLLTCNASSNVRDDGRGEGRNHVSRSYGSSPVARLYLAKYEAPEEEAAVVPFALLVDQPQENFPCKVSSHSMLLCNAFTTRDRSIPQVK